MGAWIEIRIQYCSHLSNSVAPLVGAWIEIAAPVSQKQPLYKSLPSWERGLKSAETMLPEICSPVAPLVGAWIEIVPIKEDFVEPRSLPSWERGLK